MNTGKKGNKVLLEKFGLVVDGPAEKNHEPTTIQSSSDANLQLARMLARRLKTVLDVLQYTGEDDDSKADSDPTGVHATLDRTGSELSEAARLLYNIESVIGISAVAVGR